MAPGETPSYVALVMVQINRSAASAGVPLEAIPALAEDHAPESPSQHECGNEDGDDDPMGPVPCLETHMAATGTDALADALALRVQVRMPAPLVAQ